MTSIVLSILVKKGIDLVGMRRSKSSDAQWLERLPTVSAHNGHDMVMVVVLRFAEATGIDAGQHRWAHGPRATPSLFRAHASKIEPHP